jgi:hypothetical protein
MRAVVCNNWKEALLQDSFNVVRRCVAGKLKFSMGLPEWIAITQQRSLWNPASRPLVRQIFYIKPNHKS